MNSELDDYYSKYNSELQDGILTEIGHAATDFKNLAIDAMAS